MYRNPFGYNQSQEVAHYKNAAVCTNGHAITSDTSRTQVDQFCKICGAEVTTQCKHCNANIQGYYKVPGVVSLAKYHPPAYCHRCGKAYPWTELKIQAAKMMIDDIEELSVEEREKMSDSIDNIIVDTPLTEVSANRIKKYLAKMGAGTANALRDILVNIASEVAIKAIGIR
ncbi:MAG: DUF2321 domain-containing protein [Rickettsiales bacterium]|jgi:hypothetical protein|nr:DUF2321 domain-containing protein [Rickettsiales bacterium]